MVQQTQATRLKRISVSVQPLVALRLQHEREFRIQRDGREWSESELVNDILAAYFGIAADS